MKTKLRVKPIHQRQWGSGQFIQECSSTIGHWKKNSYPQTFIFDIHLRGLMLWFEFRDIHNARAWCDNFAMILRLGLFCNYWHWSMNLYIISEHLVPKLIRHCGFFFCPTDAKWTQTTLSGAYDPLNYYLFGDQ